MLPTFVFRQLPSINFLHACFGIALCVALGSGCRPDGVGQADGTDEPAVVWSVPTESGKKLYLAGSLHLLGPGDHPLPQVLLDSLDACRVLITESGPLEGRNREELDALIAERGRLPEGQSLSEVVGGEARALLLEHYRSTAGSRAGLDSLRPWLAAVRIGTGRFLAAGVDRAHGVEATLLQRAERRGMRTGGLESPAAQLGVFADMPPEREEKLLLEVLEAESGEGVAVSYGRLRQAWRGGDLDALARHVEENTPGGEAGLEGRLLYERSRRFAGRIEELARTPAAEAEDTFVLVGVGHLVGARGVPSLLRARMGIDLVRVLPRPVAGD